MREAAAARSAIMWALASALILVFAGCNEEPMRVEDVMGWWGYQYEGRVDTTSVTAYVSDSSAPLPPDVTGDVPKGVQYLYQDGTCSKQIYWWEDQADENSISIGVHNPTTGLRATHVWKKERNCPGMYREIWKMGEFRQGDCMARVDLVPDCPE